MIKELIEEAKKDHIEIEVFVKTVKTHEILLLNNEIDKFSNDNITTYQIKAIYNGKTIIIKADEINPQEIIGLIKENTAISDNDDKDILTESSISEGKIYEEKQLDYQKITDDLINIGNIRQQYKAIETLSILFRHTYEINEIINSNVHLKDSNEYNYIYTEISFLLNGKAKSCFFNLFLKDEQFTPFKKKLISNIEENINSTTVSSCKSDKYSVLLNNECVYRILDTFSSMFSAEQMRKKNSILSERFKQKVFSDKLTIVEDPTNESLVGKRAFDDEGITTKYKEIIKDGKFVTKLYNRQSALKENTSSTGNSYGVRNMYILPGEKSFENLIEELNSGIMITHIEGMHAGIDIKNGQISLQAEGWYVEGGKRIRPLNMIVLSTNLFELLNSVKEVGNDLEFFGKTGGAPSLLVENIMIAGKE